MIKVLFFASLRERIGCGSLILQSESQPLAMDSLIDLLAAKLGEEAAALLRQDNTVVALNHRTADAGAQVYDGDEVAFYPPVTGG